MEISVWRGRGRAVAGPAGAATVGAALAGSAMAAAATGAAYATWVEPRLFALRRVGVPCLPAGTRPLRVLHVSDLHLVPRQHRKREWVAGLAALEPDLVVNTGDNLAAHDAVPAALETLDHLLDVPGVFVLGSNDYFAPRLKNPLRYLDDSHVKVGLGDGRDDESLDPSRLPTHELVEGFTSRGWLDLTNARERLEVAGVPLEVVGVDDPHLDYEDYASVSAPAAADAALTIVEFMDYRCGYCRQVHPQVVDLIATDKDVRVIIKEFPILGEESELASRFAVAVKQIAGDEAYERAHNALMEMRGRFTLESLGKLAGELELEREAILDRMNTEAVTAAVATAAALATVAPPD